MGTCNFTLQNNFNLYAKYCNDAEAYDYFVDDFYYALEDLQNDKLIKQPLYHEITLKSGYYDGLQLYVEHTDNDYNVHPKYLDNDDCHYIYDKCKSLAIREYEQDIKRTKKLMSKLAHRLNMTKIQCIGVFSNGEAIYQECK